MDFCQGGVWEPSDVDVSRMAKVIPGGFGDRAGELGAANTADAHRLEGDCPGYIRIAEEFRTVTGGCVGCNNQRIILFIPGIETRCAPRPLFTYSGDAQQVVSAEERSDTFVKGYSFHLYVSIGNPASVSTRSTTVITSSSIVCGLL